MTLKEFLENHSDYILNNNSSGYDNTLIEKFIPVLIYIITTGDINLRSINNKFNSNFTEKFIKECNSFFKKLKKEFESVEQIKKVKEQKDSQKQQREQKRIKEQDKRKYNELDMSRELDIADETKGGSVSVGDFVTPEDNNLTSYDAQDPSFYSDKEKLVEAEAKEGTNLVENANVYKVITIFEGPDYDTENIELPSTKQLKNPRQWLYTISLTGKKLTAPAYWFNKVFEKMNDRGEKEYIDIATDFSHLLPSKDQAINSQKLKNYKIKPSEVKEYKINELPINSKDNYTKINDVINKPIFQEPTTADIDLIEKIMKKYNVSFEKAWTALQNKRKKVYPEDPIEKQKMLLNEKQKKEKFEVEKQRRIKERKEKEEAEQKEREQFIDKPIENLEDKDSLIYEAIYEVLRDLKEAALDKLDQDKSTPVINNTTKEIEYAQAIPADPTNPSQSELSAEIVDPKNPTNKKIVPINTSEYEQPQTQV